MYKYIYLLFFIFINLNAQTFNFKPFIGYTKVNMADFNRTIQSQVDVLSDLSQQNLPRPENMDGDYLWGFQVEYHLEENYFININSYYFREKTGSSLYNDIPSDPLNFKSSHQIRLVDLSIGIKYYLSYSSWKRINLFFGFGVGIGMGWSKSELVYNDYINNYYSNGEFSSIAMTGNFILGMDLRLMSGLSIVIEGGYRYSNMGRMDGQLLIHKDFPNDTLDFIDNGYTTQTYYNFSGIFITAGPSISLPF